MGAAWPFLVYVMSYDFGPEGREHISGSLFWSWKDAALSCQQAFGQHLGNRPQSSLRKFYIRCFHPESLRGAEGMPDMQWEAPVSPFIPWDWIPVEPKVLADLVDPAERRRLANLNRK